MIQVRHNQSGNKLKHRGATILSKYYNWFQEKQVSTSEITSVLIWSPHRKSFNKSMKVTSEHQTHLGVTLSLARYKVCGVCPSVVGHWVGKMVGEVFNWSLSSNNGLNKETKHGEHS